VDRSLLVGAVGVPGARRGRSSRWSSDAVEGVEVFLVGLREALLRPGLAFDDAAEHYSALLGPELFHLLTVTRRWDPDRYRHWVWETPCREFFP
jgi:hypothetical protein